MIGISDTLPEHDNTYEMHRLLAALFTNTLNAKQKIDIINKEYDIPVESDIEEGVSIMCNLSQGIEEKALEKGTYSDQISSAFHRSTTRHTDTDQDPGIC